MNRYKKCGTHALFRTLLRCKETKTFAQKWMKLEITKKNKKMKTTTKHFLSHTEPSLEGVWGGGD